MPRREFDQVGDATRVDAGLRLPLRDLLDREPCRSRLVVAAPRLVDRVVVEHRQCHFARLRPARPRRNLVVMPQHLANMVEVVVGPRRLRMRRFQRAALRFAQDERQAGDRHGISARDAAPPADASHGGSP